MRIQILILGLKGLKHVKSQSCLCLSLLHHHSFVGIIQAVMSCVYIR